MSDENMKEYLRGLLTEETVLKYLFVKSMEDKYDDKYLSAMYKINVNNIRHRYDVLNVEERTRVERHLQARIEAGEIDLNKEAVKWHKEGLVKEKNDEINRENAKKSKKDNLKGDER